MRIHLQRCRRKKQESVSFSLSHIYIYTKIGKGIFFRKRVINLSNAIERPSKMRTEKCTLDLATWKVLDMLPGIG